MYILRSSAWLKNLDLLCARTFEDQVLDAFCVLLPTAEMSRQLSCVIGIIWMISGWEVDDIHWIYQRYLKQIFTGLSFFKSSRLSWHCSAQLIKGLTINVSKPGILWGNFSALYPETFDFDVSYLNTLFRGFMI